MVEQPPAYQPAKIGFEQDFYPYQPGPGQPYQPPAAAQSYQPVTGQTYQPSAGQPYQAVTEQLRAGQHGQPANTTGAAHSPYPPEAAHSQNPAEPHLTTNPHGGAAVHGEELVAVPRVGSNAVRIVCPYCRATVVTNVAYHAGALTWILFAVLLVLGFWMCLCLIPLCVKSCKDVTHTCPNCRQVIGTYTRL